MKLRTRVGGRIEKEVFEEQKRRIRDARVKKLEARRQKALGLQEGRKLNQ